jgi:hypothetical protein
LRGPKRTAGFFAGGIAPGFSYIFAERRKPPQIGKKRVDKDSVLWHYMCKKV